MLCFKAVDIIGALREVMLRNTEGYQSDFEIDIETIRDAAESGDEEQKWLYWMSRKLGTYTFPERDVYFLGSITNSAWRYYREEAESVIAFLVEITEIRDGIVRGNLYEMDYLDSVNEVAKNGIDTAQFSAKYEKGIRNYPCDGNKLKKGIIPADDPDFGKLLYLERIPEKDDGRDFDRYLKRQREKRHRMKGNSFERYLKSLDRRKG